MKKILIKVFAGVVAVIFVFAAGYWAGINFSSFGGNIFKSGSNNTMDDGENSKSLLNEISRNLKDSFNIEPLKETIELINSDALEEKSNGELMKAAIEGMLSLLNDRHAEYFTADEYKQIMESYSGTMSGVGIIVTQDEEGKVVVVRPIPGTPAYEAGIIEGDIITEVEGKSLEGMAIENVVSLIKGEEGTQVNLKLFRPDEEKTFEVTITRARFYVPNLFSEMLEDNIGYIQYFDFQDKGSQQLDREVEKLLEEGAGGIIFDLRNNLGGVLEDAVEVSDLFLDEGMIVSIKGRTDSQERTDEYVAGEGKYTDIPLIVLINEFSASASELVAGALKDNERAVLIGERSFGKGTVQVIHELSDGSGLKFTTAKYFLPSGISIEGVGVKPDIQVEFDPEAEEDLQLGRAIEEIKSLMEREAESE